MKKFILFIAFIIIYGSNYSQTYYPFPDSNAVWSEINGLDDPPWRIYHLFGLLNQDTIIDSIKYHKLFSFSDTIFTKENATFIGGIREDSLKRVYYKGKNIFESFIWDYHPDEEKLLYDFSLNVGDTFRLNHSYAFSEGHFLVVSKIDSVLINNKYRKRINFGDSSANWIREVWIEGIGNIPRGLLYTSDPNTPICDFNNTLICFKQNDILLYMDSAFSKCYFYYDDIKENETFEKNIKIFPNPVSNELTISFDKSTKATFFLYNIYGKLLKSKHFFSNKTTLSLSGYSDGIYYYSIKSGEKIIKNGVLIIKK